MDGLDRINRREKRDRIRRKARKKYTARLVEASRNLIRNGMTPGEALGAIKERCYVCGGGPGPFHKNLDLHHYAGYEGENQTKVVTVCRTCHAKIHAEERR